MQASTSRPWYAPRRSLQAWLFERLFGLTLGALLVLLFALFVVTGCSSPQTIEAAQRLGEAQSAVERVRVDPEASDEDWKAAVLELAAAQEAYVRSVHGDAQGWLTSLPASAEGGAYGAAVAGLLYLMRQRTRGRLEQELEATHQLAIAALKTAQARGPRLAPDPMAGSVEGQ